MTPPGAELGIGFLHQAGAAAILVPLTLSIQCAGMGVLINWGIAHFTRDVRRLGPVRSAALIVRFTSVMIALHLLQILLWAAFYRWNCLPSWESAFYFSITSYSTVGYGDLVLPRMWRTLGPVESVTGVLMCGLSASFLFAIVTRLVEREERFSEPVKPAAERAPKPEPSIAQR
jgi:voltage-gated potassium channel